MDIHVNDTVKHGVTGWLGTVEYADPAEDVYSIRWDGENKAIGYCQAELDENHVHVPKCRYCMRPLTREMNKDLRESYPLVCKSCDENFYSFEAVK